MIRSMTGFGEASRDLDDFRLRIEVRSVNHRAVRIQVRTGQGLEGFEPALRDAVRAALSRGQVTIAATLESVGGQGGAPPKLDVDRARAYLGALKRLQSELDVPGEIDVNSLLRFGDIFRAPGQAADVDEATLADATSEALGALDRTRVNEGARLEADLRERLEAIRAAVDAIEGLAPDRLVRERDRLRAAIVELSERPEVDEDRLAREIAYLAERWDVNEEVVRLRAHTAAYLQAIDGAGEEPVGKRLGFLAQEMHREANTIGSKANDAAIQSLVVSIKEEIDRLKEQAENIE